MASLHEKHAARDEHVSLVHRENHADGIEEEHIFVPEWRNALQKEQRLAMCQGSKQNWLTDALPLATITAAWYSNG